MTEKHKEGNFTGFGQPIQAWSPVLGLKPLQVNQTSSSVKQDRAMSLVTAGCTGFSNTRW